MKSFAIFMLFLLKLMPVLSIVVFGYGLMYMSVFSDSLVSVSISSKVFIFFGGLTIGMIGVRYLTLSEKKKEEKLFIPDDIKVKVAQLIANNNSPTTMEEVIVDIFNTDWYKTGGELSTRPKDLALLTLFVVNQLNIEREIHSIHATKMIELIKYKEENER